MVVESRINSFLASIMIKIIRLLVFSLFATVAALTHQSAFAAEAPPVVYLLKSFEKAPHIALPYGDRVLLQAFPKRWDYPPRSKKETPPESTKYYDLYNKLESFRYSDFEENKLTINVKQKNLSLYFKSINEATNSIQTDRLKSQYKVLKTVSTEVKVAQLKNFAADTSIKTFSLQLREKLDCKKCEYPESQTRNILINIDSDFNIIDSLLISASIGGDLGRSDRHFYIDMDKIIHLKDFDSGELEGGFQKYQKYKLLPSGRFSKLK
jgi:hypothetical protein